MAVIVPKGNLGDNANIREDPLVPPAAIDCAIVAAPMTPAAPYGEPRDRPSHSQSASLYLLSTLLPPTASAFEDALLHSASAFGQLDRWLGLETLTELQSGQPAERLRPDAEELDEYPLARLLTEPAPNQLLTGLTLVKALLLVGHALGRPETQVMATVAAGAVKARRIDAWRRLLPPPQPESVSLPDAVRHCTAHAEAKLASASGVNRQGLDWLKAFLRWCNLIAAEPATLKWRPHARTVIEVAAVPTSGDQPEEPGGARVDTLGLDEGDRDDDPLADEDEDEGTSAFSPSANAPEAPSRVNKALPRHDDEPETPAGGEARRVRTGFRTALENQRLPWVNHELTPDDRSLLVSALKEALVQHDQAQRDTAGLLALAHVSGQLMEQITGLSTKPRPGASYLAGSSVLMRWVPPPEQAWCPPEDQAAGLRPQATHIPLLLPAEIRQWLDLRLGATTALDVGQALGTSAAEAVARARRWLEELREQTGGLQTLGRVERWLPNALYQARRDHVPPHLICAINDGQACPAAYYRAYPATALAEQHRGTLEAAGWTMASAPSPAPSMPSWVGSRLNPDFDAVKSMWAATTRHFAGIVADSKRPLHERHNAREIHETLSLVFQTFHRAVSDPIESLEYIDLSSRQLLLTDKQQGDARAHRQVPLTQLAKRQCEEHIEHLRRLAIELAPHAPLTAARVAAIVAHPEWRAAPFRFLLNERLEIVRIRPAALLAALPQEWKWPLNLARHFGSTWLLEAGASDEALVSFLGHHDLGTQNLTIVSPRDFDSLFGHLTQQLDALTTALGLQSIPSFLPALAAGAELPKLSKRPPQMLFGHRLREHLRARKFKVIGEATDLWISEQLQGRPASKLTQDDVDALFERVRKATPNRRTYWASERFEAMRDAIVQILDKHSDLKVELPAIALTIKDVSHICPLDGLAAAAWLRSFRPELERYWESEFRSWRAARDMSYIASPEALVLTLAVDSLAIDPRAWECWTKGDRRIDVFLDEHDRAWIRLPLPAGNSRLYPVRRALAEMIPGVTPEDWSRMRLEEVAGLANSLAAAAGMNQPVRDFWQLLNRLQSASAAHMPGIVLGYADGSHGSVSVEAMCLERASGDGPTMTSLARWHAPKEQAEREPEAVAGAEMTSAEKGSMADVAAFRREMARAMARLDRSKAQAKADRKAKAKPSVQAAAQGAADPGGHPPEHRTQVGPIKRFTSFVEQRWDQLTNSPGLPPVCELIVKWIHTLADKGQRSGESYAPKTLRNYWYSWALRVLEEFGPLDPREMSAGDLEELYLQIVENAEGDTPVHLFAPMRNMHRYLAENHGVCEIEWAELRYATGQGQTHVDANILHEHEYFRALQLLQGDPSASARVRALSTAALVLLYRFGLRIAECHGLHASDVYRDASDGRWRVRVRGNAYRGLKTTSARRIVVALEPLTDLEHGLLRAWCDHVQAYAASNEVRPLFALTAGGEQRAQLFPRRVIALRLAQALRMATGDPGVRIHHCRHSYATRVLRAGLAGDTVAGRRHPGAQAVIPTALRELLTSETDATRRVIWAIAAMLGHSSPLTTLETYFHGGHELLYDWCTRRHWGSWPDLPAEEWAAFACGTKLKTLQRALQRAGESAELANQPRARSSQSARSGRQEGQRALKWALGLWSRVPRIAEGDRVRLESSLPPLKWVDESARLKITDRIIDHARRFGRLEGLADRLFTNELWAEAVLTAAADFAASRRSKSTPPSQWWIEDKDAAYGDHETLQVDTALERLQRLDARELDAAAEIVSKYLVPSRRMVVIENVDSLEIVAALAKRLVDDESIVELLVPAKLAPRPSVRDRVVRLKSATSHAGKVRLVEATRKPRLKYRESAVDVTASTLIDAARRLGLSESLHGRVAGAREDTHSWLRSGHRFGLRVRENGYDRMRSAKIFSRVLATVAVARSAEKLLQAG